MSTEIYSIITDTLNGTVDTQKLKIDITNSSIVSTLNRIDTSGDTLSVVFDLLLSGAEQTILTGIINAHDGIPIPKTNSPQLVELNIKTKSKGIPKVAVVKRDGDGFVAIVSHEFTNKTSWYQKSTRVTGETLTNEGGNIFGSSNDFWIDMTSGNILDEGIVGIPYFAKIYDNGILQTEGVGADYTVNYETGKVTFNSSPTGPITADYSYAGSSMWIITPNAGKIINIEHAELDFTIDATLTETHFEIWAYNPLFNNQETVDAEDEYWKLGDPGNPLKFMVSRRIYKNIKDVVKIANTIEIIDALSGIGQKLVRAVFDYAEVIELKASQGTELRIHIKDEAPFNGGFSSVTVYTTIEDEV